MDLVEAYYVMSYGRDGQESRIVRDLGDAKKLAEKYARRNGSADIFQTMVLRDPPVHLYRLESQVAYTTQAPR